MPNSGEMFIGALNTESDLNEMLLIKRKRNSTNCTVEQNFASYPKMITMITVQKHLLKIPFVLTLLQYGLLSS